MDIKGTAVISIRDFVGKYYNQNYNQWLNALPESSRKIFQEGVYANKWYPMEEACVVPTSYIGEIFFEGDNIKAAWENGRYSADEALKGFYWFYVKVGNPQHIIKRASRLFAAYYHPCEIELEKVTKFSFQLVIKQFQDPSEIVENRIGGWMERALEISGCKNLKVQITESLAKNDNVTRYDVSWKY